MYYVSAYNVWDCIFNVSRTSLSIMSKVDKKCSDTVIDGSIFGGIYSILTVKD